MRVVLVSHSAAIGGAQLVLLEGARALAARGVQVHVVLPAHGELTESLEAFGIPFHIVRYRWWAWAGRPRMTEHARVFLAMMRDAGAVIRLAQLLRQLDADLVVSNTIVLAVGAFAAKVARRPHIWHVHEFGREDHDLRFALGERLSLGLVHRLSARILTVSESLAESYKARGLDRKLRTVYAAVDLPHRPDVATEHAGLLLVHVAALAPSKGQEDGIRAVALLLQDGLDVRLRLVGGAIGGYDDYLQRRAHALGIAAQVELTGFASDPFKHFRNADIVLICSRREAFGRATVEAMKVGKPVIGTRTGATMELVRDGWNGLLYEPGNAEELAERIKLLAESPERRSELGRNGQEWARRTFNLEGYGAALAEVFSEVVGRGGC